MLSSTAKLQPLAARNAEHLEGVQCAITGPTTRRVLCKYGSGDELGVSLSFKLMMLED